MFHSYTYSYSYLIKSFMTELAVGNLPAPGPAKVVSAKLSEFTTTLKREKEEGEIVMS
jgi:hypothetical protein